jgi:hypothetical protein
MQVRGYTSRIYALGGTLINNCPHDGRASRISGGLVDFYIY